MKKTIRVPAKQIDDFERLVKERFPGATVSPGRKMLNRDDTINAQYFVVEIPGAADDAIDHFWMG